MPRTKKIVWAAAGILAAVVFLLALLNFSLPQDILAKTYAKAQKKDYTNTPKSLYENNYIVNIFIRS